MIYTVNSISSGITDTENELCARRDVAAIPVHLLNLLQLHVP